MYSTTYLAKQFVATNWMKNLWKFCCNIEFLYFFNTAFWQNFKSHFEDFNKHTKKAKNCSNNLSKHNSSRKRIRCHKFNEKYRELWIFVLFQQSILTKFSVTFWGFYYTRKQMVGQKYRQNITYLAKEFVATKSTEPRNPAHFLRATHVCWSFLFLLNPRPSSLIPNTEWILREYRPQS
jgi:hypothetical protein